MAAGIPARPSPDDTENRARRQTFQLSGRCRPRRPNGAPGTAARPPGILHGVACENGVDLHEPNDSAAILTGLFPPPPIVLVCRSRLSYSYSICVLSAAVLDFVLVAPAEGPRDEYEYEKRARVRGTSTSTSTKDEHERRVEVERSPHTIARARLETLVSSPATWCSFLLFLLLVSPSYSFFVLVLVLDLCPQRSVTRTRTRTRFSPSTQRYSSSYSSP